MHTGATCWRCGSHRLAHSIVWPHYCDSQICSEIPGGAPAGRGEWGAAPNPHLHLHHTVPPGASGVDLQAHPDQSARLLESGGGKAVKGPAWKWKSTAEASGKCSVEADSQCILGVVVRLGVCGVLGV